MRSLKMLALVGEMISGELLEDTLAEMWHVTLGPWWAGLTSCRLERDNLVIFN
jgi:hypothetical protein